MKKYIFLFSCLFGSQALLAAPITPDEALSRLAEGEMPARVRAASGELRLARTVKTAAGNPAVYVFARQSGETLFVSADDLARPLLGFTDSTPTGELPPQLEWWLSEYAREIEHARPAKAPAQAEGVPAPDYVEITRPDIAPMITTRWNQDEPYSLLCPEIGDRHCYTGCVATAAAQVMYYFRYPEKGRGSISYYSNEDTPGSYKYSGTLSLDFSTITFDWANMLPDYESVEATAAQKTAVATLMKAVGYASQMNYGTDASGASVNNCVAGMQEYLGYNEKASLAGRGLFSRTAWESLVYENLQKVGPVLYRGSNLIGAGHAFVCDGYADGYFHFNWGWGGYYNGMFSLSALTPDGEGIGGNGTSDYSFDQEVCINLTRPDAGTFEVNIPRVSGYGSLSAGIDGTTITLTAIRTLINNTSKDLNVRPALRLTDAAGSSIDVKWSQSVLLEPGYGYAEMEFRLRDDLADGTYTGELMWSDGSDDFAPVARPVGCTASFTLTVKEGKYSVENPAAPTYTITDVQLLSPLYQSAKFKVAFKATNASSVELANGVQPWIYQREAGATPQYIFTTDRLAMGQGVFLDLMPGESMDVNQIFEMESLISPISSPMQCYLALVNSADLSILYEMPVTLNPATTECSPQLDAFTFEGDAANANPDDLRFKVKFTNNAGLLADPITVAVYDAAGPLVGTIDSPTLFVPADKTAETEIKGSLNGMFPDTDYIAYVYYIDREKNAYALMEPLSPVNLHVSKDYAGISAAEATADLSVTARGGEVRLAAQKGVAAADLYAADGRLLRHAACGGATEASVTLPESATGIVICRVTLADGNLVVRKIALR